MKNRRNYYRILQVQPDAEIEIIRASYLTLMRELGNHPDLGGEHIEASLLNEAYEMLSHSAKRAQYDKQLLKHYTINPNAKAESEKKPLITVACPYCRQSLARNSTDNDSNCSACCNPLESANETRTDKDCRRATKRIKKEQTIWYHARSPNRKQSGKMIDFSPQGLRFKGQEYLKPQAVIHVSAAFFSAVAQVKSSQALVVDDEGLFAIGVRFNSLNITGQKGSLLSTSV